MFGRSRESFESLRDRIDYEAARAQAREAAHSAREWAEPRARRAYRKGVRRSAPYVQQAGGKAEDWADAAHAAIVGSAIPAVIDAFRKAGEEPVEKNERKVPASAVVIPAALIGAAAAAVVVWAKSDPGPSAEDVDEDGNDRRTGLDRARTQINEALTSAEETVGHVAQVVATTSGAAVSAVADAARPYADKVRDGAGPAMDKVKPTVDKVKKTANASATRARTATRSVADEVEKAMEDFENVWGDETEDTTPAKKKPATRKRSTKGSGTTKKA